MNRRLGLNLHAADTSEKVEKNMRHENEHNEHFEKLTEEIRSLGTPYQSAEPDERYWANFRVRVMDSIEVREHRGFAGFLDRVREFVSEHVLGTSLAGAAAAVVVGLTMVLNPFSQSADVPSKAPQFASRQNVAPVAPAPEVKSEVITKPQVAASAKDSTPSEKPVVADIKPTTREDLAYAEETPSEVAVEPVTIHGDADGPVSLNELSTPELETVLESVKEIK